jgi:HSP20 family protein
MAKTKLEARERKQELQEARPVPVVTPFEEMDRFFERVFPRGWMRPFLEWERNMWPDLLAPMEAEFPRVDIIDRDDEILVRAEIPGVEKEGLDVSVADDRVTIKAARTREAHEEKGDFYRREISHGTFGRTLRLPSEVDGTKAKATFKRGVLEMTLPKVEKTQRHSISIE